MVNVAHTAERLPDSRQEAIESGAVRYFTGEPCKRGHKSPRYTLTGGCVACIDARNAAERQLIRDVRSRKSHGG